MPRRDSVAAADTSFDTLRHDLRDDICASASARAARRVPLRARCWARPRSCARAYVYARTQASVQPGTPTHTHTHAQIHTHTHIQDAHTLTRARARALLLPPAPLPPRGHRTRAHAARAVPPRARARAHEGARTPVGTCDPIANSRSIFERSRIPELRRIATCPSRAFEHPSQNCGKRPNSRARGRKLQGGIWIFPWYRGRMREHLAGGSHPRARAAGGGGRHGGAAEAPRVV